MKKINAIIVIVTMLCSTLLTTIGLPHKTYASTTTTTTLSAISDLFQIMGSNGYDGVYTDDFSENIYVGITNDPDFGENVKNRAAIHFRLLEHKPMLSAELELSVNMIEGAQPLHPLFMDIHGSIANELQESEPSIPVADAAVPPKRYDAPLDGDQRPTHPPGHKIRIDVTDLVKGYTSLSDPDMVFILTGNELDRDSGRFFIYSNEHADPSQRPQLHITYMNNQPPTGTFAVEGGTSTNHTSVNLNISASDPDDDDIISMRFSENVSQWPDWEPFAYSKSLALSPGDGQKTIYMQVRDSQGLISQAYAMTITVDTTAPTGSISINNGATWTSDRSAVLQLQAQDDAGQHNIDMRLSDASLDWTPWEPYSASYAWTLPDMDGPHTIYVEYRDSFGNVSPQTMSASIGLDRVKPTGSITINSGAIATGNKQVALQLQYHDDSSGSGVVEMRLRNETQAAGSATWEPAASTKSWTLDSGEGSKSVYAAYRDAAGNVSDEYSSVIILDETPPVVTGVQHGGLYRTSVTVHYNEGTATLNGSAFTSGSEVKDEGHHTLIVTDAAGNTTTVAFTIDTTAPTGTFMMNGDSDFTNTKNVKLTLSGLSSDVKEMQVSNDPAAFDDASGWQSLPTGELPWVLETGDGEKTVYMRFRDEAGNISDIVSKTIYVLTAKPSGQVAVNNGDEWTNQSNVQLTFTGVSEHITDLQITDQDADWTAVPWTPLSASISWGLPAGDGPKTVYVRFRDAAGNISDTAQASIKLDTDAPAGEISINGGAAWATSPDVSLQFTNVSSDAVGMQVSMDNTNWPGAWSPIAPVVQWSLSAGDGEKKVYVRFKDAAGNIGQPDEAWIKLDTTPPTGAVAVNNGAEWTTSRDAVLTLSAISPDAAGMQISDRVDAWPSTWTPVSLSVPWNLPAGDGTKTIFVRFKDEAGWISQAIQAVIKLDTTPPTGLLAINHQDAWTNQTEVNLAITMEDGSEGSQTAEMRFSNNGSDWSSWEAAALAKMWSLTSGDGEKTVQVQLKDHAGLVSQQAIQASIKLDQTKPVGEIKINGGESSTSSRQVNLTLTSSDEHGSGIKDMRFSHDGKQWSSWEPAAAKKTWSLQGGSGEKRVYVQFRDHALNSSEMYSESIQYSGYSGGGYYPFPDEDNQDKISIRIDDTTYKGYKVEQTSSGDHTTVILDEAELIKALEGVKAGPAVIISLLDSSRSVIMEMTAAAYERLRSKQASIMLNGGYAGYTVSLPKIPADAIAKEHKGSKLRVQLEQLSADVSTPSTLLTAPIRFSLATVQGDRIVEIGLMNGLLEHTITIPSNVDASRVTTAVRIGTDGRSLAHVPTTIVTQGSETMARFYTPLGSGTYGLIYHQAAFKDTAKHWAHKSIEEMASRMILLGTAKDQFEPQKEITRAEFTAMILRAMGLEQVEITDHREHSYTDIGLKPWYASIVHTGSALGLIDGYQDGTFKPNASITRQEAVVVIARAIRWIGVEDQLSEERQQQLLEAYQDSHRLGNWAKASAALALHQGIVVGDQGKLSPTSNITRAETAVMIQRLLEKAQLIQ